jgi:transcriptional repressor NrdR
VKDVSFFETLNNFMVCPYCAHPENKVCDSRESEDGKTTRRRRECLKCRKRFTTYERVETLEILVVKKNGRRELFNRDKIRVGIMKACEKRPVSADQIEKLVDDVESEVRGTGLKEISSKKIGQVVTRLLKKIDKVAYIRFASVYREFADLTDFEKELDILTKNWRRKVNLPVRPDSVKLAGKAGN